MIARLRAGIAGADRDRLFMWTLYGAVGIFGLIVLGLFEELVRGSWPSIVTFGLHFLVTSKWDPVTGQFGALPMIYGTVVSSVLALIFAGLIGVFAAAYLADFAPRFLATPLSFLIELLAAVPSVVFGLWGLFVLAPFLRTTLDPFLQAHLGFLPLFAGPIYGIGFLTAALILALMIVPTVTAISRDVIVAAGTPLREASISLGATKWETMWNVIIPAARTGIFGACTLAFGRALGETIAATMVIGNRPQIAASLFAPGYTLSSVIANEFTEATTPIYLSALLELGLLLFVISMIVNGLARFMMWAMVRKDDA